MKQNIFGICAIATMLTACSNDDTISVVAKEAITFGRTFVENSTRAVTDNTYGGGTAELKSFNVYGTVTEGSNTANIFDGDDVTYSETEEKWDYTNTQYWIPGCAYDFIALADAGNVTTGDNGMPASITYEVSSQKDLLLATANKQKEESANAGEISFSFNHLLAKVQFTFTNAFAESTGVELTVKDIKITNAPKQGTYSIDSKSWEVENETSAVEFGESEAISAGGGTGASQYAKVLLPGKCTYNITFTVGHNKGGEDTYKTLTTGEVELKAGHSYNFTADLNANNVAGVGPITFTITTNNGWSSEKSYGVTGPYPEEGNN